MILECLMKDSSTGCEEYKLNLRPYSSHLFARGFSKYTESCQRDMPGSPQLALAFDHRALKCKCRISLKNILILYKCMSLPLQPTAIKLF
jgi:hypothetical protein